MTTGKSIFSRIRNAAAVAVAAVAMSVEMVFGRYEAGQLGTRGRSYLPAWVRDARFDADQMTRLELVRKSRYFERNSGIVNRLADLFEQFTVGACGVPMIPTSDDEDWNVKASEVWSEWCRVPDLTSRQSFSTLQSLIARTWFVDGEVFILKTRGSSTYGSRPRVQLIEGHRVQTPSQHWHREGVDIIDGIEIDANGRPVRYWVRDTLKADEYVPIPAEEIIHVFEPSRSGQYRGLPFMYSVLNDLHDLDDLQILEMQAAKKNAQVANVVKTASGKLEAADMIRARITQTGVTAAGEEASVKRVQAVQQVLGAETVVMKTDESIERYESERPTVTTQAYWDYITSKVCAGVGISKLLVFPFSMQGTVTRADLDVANVFFRSRSAFLCEAFVAIYHYVIGWSVTNDKRLVDKPATWKNVTARPPRSVNVDIGRNSSAVLAELDAGVRTYEDIYAEMGKDWRTELRQRAREEKYINELCKEFVLTPDRIRISVGAQLARMAAEEKAAKEKENAQAL